MSNVNSETASRKPTKEEIIAAIQACATKLGHVPSQEELKAESGIYGKVFARHFGNYTKALRASLLPRICADARGSKAKAFTAEDAKETSVSGELPDAAWDMRKYRDPSTQPHLPLVVRLSVGMTGGGVGSGQFRIGTGLHREVGRFRGREAADPMELAGHPRDFPSVRKWDTLSLRIPVGCVQVIARREDYRGQNRCRPTQHS